jgi:purine-binding chemotaxis protein CheW
MILNRRATDVHENRINSGSVREQDWLQFISFSLGDQEYGVDIMHVREIKAWSETTRLPNSPDYMRGVINLRGAIVPVIDLGIRFGNGVLATTSSSVIIIVSVAGVHTGLLVDAVSDIIAVDRKEVAAIPEIDGERRNLHFSGLLTVQDKMIAIVSLENLLGTESNVKSGELPIASSSKLNSAAVELRA